MLISTHVLSAVLVAALIGSACGGGGPTAPTRTSSAVTPAQPQPPAPSPAPPAPDLSRLVGTWNVTVRLTAVTAGSSSSCVGETMRSQIGAPNAYSLQFTTDERVSVMLTSASGDYACTFAPTADSNSFTTYDVPGYFTCRDETLAFRCDNGTMRHLFPWGQNISGRVSGREITGTWDASWEDMSTGAMVETKAEFTGRR